MIRRAEKAESELKALARQSRMIRFVECAMKLAELRDDEKSALYYAEGWLSAGYGSPFLAAWNGARYKYPKKRIGNLLRKALLAMKVKRSLDERGLKKGFDIKTLGT